EFAAAVGDTGEEAEEIAMVEEDAVTEEEAIVEEEASVEEEAAAYDEDPLESFASSRAALDDILHDEPVAKASSSSQDDVDSIMAAFEDEAAVATEDALESYEEKTPAPQSE